MQTLSVESWSAVGPSYENRLAIVSDCFDFMVRLATLVGGP